MLVIIAGADPKSMNARLRESKPPDATAGFGGAPEVGTAAVLHVWRICRYVRIAAASSYQE